MAVEFAYLERTEGQTVVGVIGYILFVGLIVFTILSFTGGFAGSIASGGREDRSLLQNAGIGLVGWVAVLLIWTGSHGSPPEEIPLAYAPIALIVSVILARILDRRQRLESSRKIVTN